MGDYRRCSAGCGKYAQDGTGMCRQCGRASGAYTMTYQERDKGVIERRRLARAASVPACDLAPRQPLVTRVIDGVEYDVMWDGS